MTTIGSNPFDFMNTLISKKMTEAEIARRPGAAKEDEPSSPVITPVASIPADANTAMAMMDSAFKEREAYNGSAQTRTDAQIIGQEEDAGEAAKGKFLEFMESLEDGPAGFLRAQILASKGLTEADLATMTPEELRKLEEEIEETIRKKIEEAGGGVASSAGEAIASL